MMPESPVGYHYSQIDHTRSSRALTTTLSPIHLLRSDIVLFFKHFLALPGIVFPLCPWRSGPLDELYPSNANIVAISTHTVLIFLQLFLLVFIPICVVFPLGWLYVAGCLTVNRALCYLLNGPRNKVFLSKVKLGRLPKHDNERWIFINGVAVGDHWLQGNLDRLAMTFGREVLGIHNLTCGIVFDVLECLIQRDFSYNTMDIRHGYKEIRKALLDKYEKVVVILHSQGGIEGSRILDWLLADLSEDCIQKLEIYTFGNAANHFNDPKRANIPEVRHINPNQPRENENRNQIIRHIEHYANSGDFVSQWGVLNFCLSQQYQYNRYMGQLFERQGSGHQLNQHYLDNMFPIDRETKRVKEHNDFVDSEVEVFDDNAICLVNGNGHTEHGTNGDAVHPQVVVAKKPPQYVRDLSRLWKYRNGMSPED